jgi:hypothetical protein
MYVYLLVFCFCFPALFLLLFWWFCFVWVRCCPLLVLFVFQLGQFNIIMDKRHVYDWDTRIHLLSRGPGIAAGSTFAVPATQVQRVAGRVKVGVMNRTYMKSV